MYLNGLKWIHEQKSGVDKEKTHEFSCKEYRFHSAKYVWVLLAKTEI